MTKDFIEKAKVGVMRYNPIFLVMLLWAFFIGLFIMIALSGCADKSTATKKLSFLNDIERNKVSFSEEEKIERIIAFYRKKLANVKNLEINFVEKIEANKELDFDAFVFDFKVDDSSQREILFVKDNFFFSDFASLETLDNNKGKAIKILERKANEHIIESLFDDSNYVVTLGTGKKEVFIFTDPLCPFCKEHMKGIDEKYLKNNKVHFIFISVQGDAGFNRAGLIYENLDRAKTDAEKLELIKTYYDSNINQDIMSEQRILDIKMLFDKYLDLGVKYVPYIIER